MISTLNKYLSSIDSIPELEAETLHLNQKVTSIQDKIKHLQLINQPQNKQQLIKQTLFLSPQQLQQQLTALSSQEEQLLHLRQFVSLSIEDPSQLRQNDERIRRLAAILESTPQPRAARLMDNWLSQIKRQQRNKLNNLVILSSLTLIINRKELANNKQIIKEHNHQHYIKTIYHQLLIYDVPTSSYILKIPSQFHNSPQQLKVQYNLITFPKEQAQSNFQHIHTSITQTFRIVQQLQQLISEPLQQIHMKKIDELQADIDYILPYLALENRKIIIDLLTTNSIEKLSIYDLLVRLKLKGQDGEMLGKVIGNLIERLKEDPGSFESVMQFLSMAQNDHKLYNMGFYVCDCLVGELEREYEDIASLLMLREQFRFKIHSD